MTNAELITIAGLALQTFIYLIAGYGLVIRNDQGSKDLKEEVKVIQLEIKEMTKVVTQLAVQTTRIDNLSGRMNMIDKRMDDIVRKSGWIEGRRVVDGEYP